MPQSEDERGERFADAVRELLSHRAPEIARAWLEALERRLAEKPQRIFTERTLLDEVPSFLRALAASLTHDELPRSDATIRSELAGLARLRRAQGYLIEELAEELDLLGDLLFRFLAEEAERLPPTPPSEVLRFTHRLQRTMADLGAYAGEVYRAADAEEWMARVQLLSSFSRAVGHELRNRVEAAQLTLRAGRQRLALGFTDFDEIFDRLARALTHLEEAATDVHALTVSQTDPETARLPRMPLSRVVERTLDELADLAAARGVRLDRDGAMPEFRINPSLLQLVLVNLVGNGIKYADPGKRERWVRVRAIELDEPGRWRIEVADNGRGIERELQDRVFRQRVRGAAGDELGEGFGLALARQAALQIGGNLDVRSELGEGSVFSFDLREPTAEIDVAEPPGEPGSS